MWQHSALFLWRHANYFSGRHQSYKDAFLTPLHKVNESMMYISSILLKISIWIVTINTTPTLLLDFSSSNQWCLLQVILYQPNRRLVRLHCSLPLHPPSSIYPPPPPRPTPNLNLRLKPLTIAVHSDKYITTLANAACTILPIYGPDIFSLWAIFFSYKNILCSAGVSADITSVNYKQNIIKQGTI